MQVCHGLIESVCDCGASVSCLSPIIFEDQRKTNGIKLQRCNKNFKAANGLPIFVKGIIRVPLTVGNKSYEQEFHVLENTETDCLLGLDFPEGYQRDPLFSWTELNLDPSHSVRMCQKTFDYNTNTVFWVLATETTLVPGGDTKTLRAHIPNWKRPPVTLNAVFEPRSKVSHENDFSVPNILFNYSDKNITISLENKADPDMITYKKQGLVSPKSLMMDSWIVLTPRRNSFPSSNSVRPAPR